MMLAVTVNGREFDVEVGSDGLFRTAIEGERLVADTLKSMQAKLKTKMAQLGSVAIPALIIEHDGWRRPGLHIQQVVLTGIYPGRYRDITYREGDNPKVGKVGTGSEFYRRLSVEELAQLHTLYLAAQAAEKAWEAALTAARMDAPKEVERAAILGPMPAEEPETYQALRRKNQGQPQRQRKKK